ncbi:MAG: DUF4251 domain-containing protein [Prevotella sp.]|nr:DUF4251 domain-containing protein [Prevotella sp.]
MKNYIFTLAMVISLAACSTMTSAERAERDAKIAAAVNKALTSRRYTVNIDRMYPLRGTPVDVSSDYSLEVKGDTLVSYLPYFGRAYNVPYGGGKALNFTALIQEYQTGKTRNGNTQITVRVDNDEDIITYILDIFPTGNTSIHVMAREREQISYTGNIEINN